MLVPVPVGPNIVLVCPKIVPEGWFLTKRFVLGVLVPNDPKDEIVVFAKALLVGCENKLFPCDCWPNKPLDVLGVLLKENAELGWTNVGWVPNNPPEVVVAGDPNKLPVDVLWVPKAGVPKLCAKGVELPKLDVSPNPKVAGFEPNIVYTNEG